MKRAELSKKVDFDETNRVEQEVLLEDETEQLDNNTLVPFPQKESTEYFAKANLTQLLTVEEEARLAHIIKSGTEEEKRAAREKFILGNLRLVIKIAHTYRNRGLSLQDLIAEGNIGLIQAVDKFEPTHGAKFSTYAANWIKQSMLRALKTQTHTIRIPFQTQIKMAKINQARRTFLQENGRQPTESELARKTGFTEASVKKLTLCQSNVVSLDDLLTNDDGDSFSRIDVIIGEESKSTADVAVEAELLKILPACLKKLNQQEQIVLRMRFGLGGQKICSLDEISIKLHRTKERVRQIQKEATARLGKMLRG